MDAASDISAAAADAAGSSATPRLLARLGLAGGAPDMRFAWRLLAVLMVLYALSFAAFYPRHAANHDEANYIRQARLALEGTSTVTQVDPFTGVEEQRVLSSYPMATALLMRSQAVGRRDDAS